MSVRGGGSECRGRRGVSVRGGGRGGECVYEEIKG